jgi:phytol kinase
LQYLIFRFRTINNLERERLKMFELYMEIIFTILAIVYPMTIVLLTKSTFAAMKKRNFNEMVAVYYNRKIVHMAAGGVVAILVPFMFDSWIYPLIVGSMLTLFTALPRLKGKSMDFMQTKENWNDSKFTLMWGISIAVMWLLFNDPFLAVIPALFMSFGDAVTGVVRNALYKRRTKSPVGNVFMLIVCLVIGYVYTTLAIHPIVLWGLLAAIVASIIERFEIGPIDDNVLITVASMIVLGIGVMV